MAEVKLQFPKLVVTRKTDLTKLKQILEKEIKTIDQMKILLELRNKIDELLKTIERLDPNDKIRQAIFYVAYIILYKGRIRTHRKISRKVDRALRHQKVKALGLSSERLEQVRASMKWALQRANLWGILHRNPRRISVRLEQRIRATLRGWANNVAEIAAYGKANYDALKRGIEYLQVIVKKLDPPIQKVYRAAASGGKIKQTLERLINTIIPQQERALAQKLRPNVRRLVVQSKSIVCRPTGTNCANATKVRLTIGALTHVQNGLRALLAKLKLHKKKQPPPLPPCKSDRLQTELDGLQKQMTKEAGTSKDDMGALHHFPFSKGSSYYFNPNLQLRLGFQGTGSKNEIVRSIYGNPTQNMTFDISATPTFFKAGSPHKYYTLSYQVPLSYQLSMNTSGSVHNVSAGLGISGVNLFPASYKRHWIPSFQLRGGYNFLFFTNGAEPTLGNVGGHLGYARMLIRQPIYKWFSLEARGNFKGGKIDVDPGATGLSYLTGFAGGGLRFTYPFQTAGVLSLYGGAGYGGEQLETQYTEGNRTVREILPWTTGPGFWFGALFKHPRFLIGAETSGIVMGSDIFKWKNLSQFSANLYSRVQLSSRWALLLGADYKNRGLYNMRGDFYSATAGIEARVARSLTLGLMVNAGYEKYKALSSGLSGTSGPTGGLSLVFRWGGGANAYKQSILDDLDRDTKAKRVRSRLRTEYNLDGRAITDRTVARESVLSNPEALTKLNYVPGGVNLYSFKKIFFQNWEAGKLNWNYTVGKVTTPKDLKKHKAGEIGIGSVGVLVGKYSKIKVATARKWIAENQRVYVDAPNKGNALVNKLIAMLKLYWARFPGDKNKMFKGVVSHFGTDKNAGARLKKYMAKELSGDALVLGHAAMALVSHIMGGKITSITSAMISQIEAKVRKLFNFKCKVVKKPKAAKKPAARPAPRK